MSTYSTILNVSYGSNPLQFVNLYYPTVTPKGTILHIHGGGWVSGDGTDPTFPSSTAASTLDVAQIAAAGYAVIDMNYRDRSPGNGGGLETTGVLPGNILDVATVLGLCLDSAAATSAGGQWPTVQSYVASHGGLVVGGSSAGGHLTISGVCHYGTISGNWPKAAISIEGPLDINYVATGTNYIDPYIRSTIVDQYVHTGLESDLKLASPFWQYGTQLGVSGAPSPGPWFNAVNNSTCKFIFLHNDYDTLVPLHTVAPCVVSFATYNSTNTSVIRVLEGPPLGNFDGFSPITVKGTLSSTSQLPSSGQTLGDVYYLPNGDWLYNNGTYPGHSVAGEINYPASVNGFTVWWLHNNTTPEAVYMLDIADSIFNDYVINPSSGTITTGTTGVSYSQQFTAHDGRFIAYTYSIARGTIPTGLTLNSSTGVLSGTPSVPGLYQFAVRAVDANGASVLGNYQLTIVSSSTITYNPKILPQGQDSIFTGLRYPIAPWHTQYSPGVGGDFLNGNISDSSNSNPDFTGKHIYVVDEIYWGTGKPAGQDLQALCDYWRYHGASPGVGINHAAEAGYSGNTPVPTATILADALRCDWVALDPYLLTSSVIYFNSGNPTINQTSINNTIAGLISWTQGWIDRLAPYGIPVVLITQGIRELGMSQTYVDQYLQAQYSTFGRYSIPMRIVFPYEVLLGLEVFTLANVDASPYINSYPFAQTNLHFPNLTSARPAKGQLYPRNTVRY